MARLAVCAALLLLLGIALGAPFSPASVTLPTSVRATRPEDVEHKFFSRYKFDQSCPDSVTISNVLVDGPRNVATVKLSDIVDDEQQCTGPSGVMSLVAERTAREEGLLAGLGFPIAAAAIKTNRNANSVAFNNNSNSNMLVGFDEGVRTCGTKTYPNSTFYFFINEPFAFQISIKVPIPSRAGFGFNSLTIPPNTRSLLITGPNERICLLTDPTTGNNGQVNVSIANQSPSPVPSSPPGTPRPETLPVQTPAGTVSPVEEPSPSLNPVTPNTGENLSGNETTPGPVCFPGSATVELESGAIVPMTALRIGDRVRTGVSTFSDVFLFTHRDADIHARFVRLVTEAGRSVTLTKSHYIYANDALVSAGKVRVGDVLRLVDGAVSRVAAVENVSATGLYNPQTVDGDIVVDGIIASAYTTAVHPRVAHDALLAPLRFLYARAVAPVAMLDALTRFISEGADTLARFVPSGPPSIAK